MSYTTFEQALTVWLESEIGLTVGPLVQKNSVSVNLNTALSQNPWQRDAAFEIRATFSNKLEAANAFAAVDAAMVELRKKTWVNTVYLLSAQTGPSSTEGSWQYLALVQILHRVRPSWQL